jgi:hypothetical protein
VPQQLPSFKIDADPDPNFDIDTDPDPIFHFAAEPDLAFYNDGDSDPHHWLKCYGNEEKKNI